MKLAANAGIITQRRSDPQTGTKINTTEELMNRWKHYFEDLLNIKINTSQITHTILPAKQRPTNQHRLNLNQRNKRSNSTIGKMERLQDLIT